MEDKVTSLTREPAQKGLGLFYAVAWISAVISGLFIALIPSLIMADYAEYGLAAPFGDSLQFFYQTNGFIGVFYFIWSLKAAIIKRAGSIFTRVCFWAILIFALLFCASFAANLYYLPQVGADAAFAFFATYTPMLCLITSIIALFCQWFSADREISNKLILVCSIISIFMTAFYCLRAAIDSAPSSTTQFINLWMVVFGSVTITLINISLFIITRYRIVFDRVALGMDNMQAKVTELLEDTVKNGAATIENEIELLEEVVREKTEEIREEHQI